VCWSNHTIQVAHAVGVDHVLVSDSVGGPRLSSLMVASVHRDGECGATHYRGLGCESCDSRGRQVDGQAAVRGLRRRRSFLLSELAVCSDAGLARLARPDHRLARPRLSQSRHPKPPVVGRATFTITGEPEATIKEEVEGPPTESETNTWSTPTGVQPGSCGCSAHLYSCR